MIKLREIKWLWKFWPPFLGLGISLKSISPDHRRVIVLLKKRPWNANYFGTQYGGAIFAMTDGMHVLMLLQNLPKKYHIWDKAATIDYLKKGRTNLTAECILKEEDLDFIKEQLKHQSGIEWSTGIEIKDELGEIVAYVKRVISIKAKQRKPS